MVGALDRIRPSLDRKGIPELCFAIQRLYCCKRPVRMTKPYSDDLRERIVNVMQSGLSCCSVAARFGVALSSVVKWTQRAVQTGSVSPAQIGGYRRPTLESHRDCLMDQVQACQHIMLAMLQDIPAHRGVAVSHGTVWRFSPGCGFSFKKHDGRRRA